MRLIIAALALLVLVGTAVVIVGDSSIANHTIMK